MNRFIYLSAPYTTKFLSQVFFKCMLDWNVNRRTSVVTLDNCSTNNAMVNRVMGLIPTNSMLMGVNCRYVARILNLIVKDWMTVIKESFKKIRDSVTY